MKPPGQRAMCSDECGQSGPHSAAGGRAVPDQDDDGGRLGHGADHAAGADHTEEGEEGLLTACRGTLPRDRPGQRRVAGHTRTPGEVLEHRRTHTHTHSIVRDGETSADNVLVH